VTASRIEARFDVTASPSLGEGQRDRIIERLGPVVTAIAQDARSQARNRDIALDRLESKLSTALARRRKRRPTRPTRSSREKRLESTRRRSQTKRQRRRPTGEE
jgi:ribosome-associated protein